MRFVLAILALVTCSAVSGGAFADVPGGDGPPHCDRHPDKPYC